MLGAPLKVDSLTTVAGITCGGALDVTGVTTLRSDPVIDTGAALPTLTFGAGSVTGRKFRMGMNDAVEYFFNADGSGSYFVWEVQSAEKARLTTGGIFAVGTTVTTGASGGDLVLANNKTMKGVNAAGTATRAIAAIDSADRVRIGDSLLQLSLSSVDVGNAQRVTAGAADSAGAGFRQLRIPN